MVSSLFLAFAFGYQLSPRPLTPSLRRGALGVSMQYQLNNYILTGPLAPLNNQVLVKLSKVEDKTKGGLFLGTTSKEKPKEGFVVAAGPGFNHPDTGKLIANPLKVGSLVLLADYSGEKVTYNGDAHVFVDASSVLGWCEGSELRSDNFRPSLDLVLLAVKEAPKETTSGIALALDEDDDNTQGEAVAVGGGRYNSHGELVPPTIAVGENVLYKKGSGVTTEIEGKKYVLVSALECIAKW